MKRVQIRIIEAGTDAAKIEREANEFLDTIPSYDVIFTSMRDGVVSIVYRDEVE